MKKIKLLLLAFILLVSTFAAQADEGMWLLQLMKEQNTIDMMKKAGLKLNANDIYNPDSVSLKDAVGIFGGGCTGEIISADGLILTNHHCGFESIQQHSSVDHDYLTNGFWTTSRDKELPNPQLTFTFIDRIVDITDSVKARIASKQITETESFSSIFLDKIAHEFYEKSDLKDKKGIEPQALPFYAGNRYYLFYKKIYTDIRMVAAPPSAVGKFGGETDNWMWPRHTGDFSMFRIYADAKGEPAAYSKNNVPLKTKKHFTISLKGVKEGSYAMIMGFPGSTERYLTASEITEMMKSENDPRIRIRGARQDVLSKAMKSSDAIRIQYASKFAMSCNYWKNSIGMNKAIVDNKVLETKAGQEKQFMDFAKAKNDTAYQNVIGRIDHVTAQNSNLTYQLICLSETFLRGIEFGSPYQIMNHIKSALKEKNDSLLQVNIDMLKIEFSAIHNKDFNQEVDKNVAKVLIPLYAEMIPVGERTNIYQFINKKYKGNYNKFIDDMYANSIISSQANFDKFIKKPTVKAIDKDLATMYSQSKYDKINELKINYEKNNDALNLLHKTYVRGLCEMKLPKPSYPDANFTIRLTYGNVKSYHPRDAVLYNYYTTTKGVLEKEDPNNREFTVPAKLKELIENKDFGRYAMADGEMPVCFLTTNDITGGNSGSPVLNDKGQLIGAAFDGNWESLSGDINFDSKLQRCICVDIRYILFILDKLGGCENLINEMTIVK